MKDDADDAALVAAALSGGPEEFGSIIERYQDAVFAVALAYLRNFHDSEDIAQEVFVEAFERINSLKNPSRLGAWLRSITIHRCIDQLRQRREVIDMEEIADVSIQLEDPSTPLRPDTEMEQQELRYLVMAAIGRLSKAQRETTTLFYINGYSQEEVAMMQKVPMGTVKRRLHDARKKLKKEMIDVVEDVLKAGAPKEDFRRRVFEILRSEFASEIQALFETYELAKEDKAREAEPVAGILAKIMKVDEGGNFVSLSIHPLKNESEKATKELKFGPSGVPTDLYDRQGRQLKIRTEPCDWHRDPYVIIETFEKVAPGAALECVSVYKRTFEVATSGHFPLLVKSDLIWRLRSANDSQYYLNHTRMILPPSAIVLRCEPQPAAIWQEGDKVCVCFRQYTGEEANGRQTVTFLWPARDGSNTRDIFSLKDEKSPLAKEYEEALQAIKGGLLYEDQSTPLKAFLTFTCGILHRDEEKLRRVTGIQGYKWPDKDDEPRWKRLQSWITSARFFKTPEWPEKPGQWDVHPIFVARTGSITHEDVHFCVYSKGKWYRPGNLGNDFMDWQEHADWARNLIIEQI